MDPELKVDQNVKLIANKTNRILGLIRRSFTFLDGPTIIKAILKYGQKYTRI